VHSGRRGDTGSAEEGHFAGPKSSSPQGRRRRTAPRVTRVTKKTSSGSKPNEARAPISISSSWNGPASKRSTTSPKGRPSFSSSSVSRTSTYVSEIISSATSGTSVANLVVLGISPSNR
jgi:hypothetical protein